MSGQMSGQMSEGPNIGQNVEGKSNTFSDNL